MKGTLYKLNYYLGPELLVLLLTLMFWSQLISDEEMQTFLRFLAQYLLIPEFSGFSSDLLIE